MAFRKGFGAFRQNCWSARLFTSRSPAPEADRLSEAQAVFYGHDAELILRVQDGDHAAFENLVDKFKAALFGFLFRMVNERGAAEELAQETFLRMYRSRSSYAGNAKSAIWMYRIAAGLAIQHEHNARGKRTNASPSGDHREENSATQAYVPTVSAG